MDEKQKKFYAARNAINLALPIFRRREAMSADFCTVAQAAQALNHVEKDDKNTDTEYHSTAVFDSNGNIIKPTR